MKLLDYIFYRCAKLAKEWFEYDLYNLWGGLIALSIPIDLVWAVIYAVLSMFDFHLTTMPYFISGFVVSLVVTPFVFTKERYAKLDGKYSGETKHYKLYGWLILLLVLASAAVLIISFQIADVDPKPTQEFINHNFKFNITRS